MSNGDCHCGIATCGCCSGVEALTPRPISNRPGLAALAVRVGSHGDFRQSLLARLSSHRFASGAQPLQALTTRDPADPTIALLDAFASIGDLLTFTSERIANESYLGTATEFQSVQNLAALVGYVPRPGVAASGWLAFEIDPASSAAVAIPKGMRVQSLPGQDELPQSFETSEALVARAAWNKIGLRLTAPHTPMGNSSELWLAGTATGLKPGDALLFDYADTPVPLPKRVLTVTPDAKAERTLVQFEPWLPAALEDQELANLLAKPPGGPKVARIAELLTRYQAMPRAKLIAAVPQFKDIFERLRKRVTDTVETSLRDWIDAIEARLDEIAGAPVSSEVVDSDRVDEADRAKTRFGTLAVAPSKPPASAAQLVRSSANSFPLGAVATLQMLRRAAPAVGEAYPAALAGDLAAAPPQPLKVYAMRLRAGLFGRGFPKRVASRETRINEGPRVFEAEEIGEWPIHSPCAGSGRERINELSLDSTYDGIQPGSWIMIDMSSVETLMDVIEQPPQDWNVRPIAPMVRARVEAVDAKRARADYGGSGDTTTLVLARPWIAYRPAVKNNDRSIAEGDTVETSVDKIDPQAIINRDFQLIRRTTVYAKPELLALAEAPITADFCLSDSNAPIELAGLHPDLEPGRYVIVSGERADIRDTEGVFASEVAMIARVVHAVRADPHFRNGAIEPLGVKGRGLPGDRIHTFVWFAGPLSYCYRRANVALYGNVVHATHGETRVEVLGNGNAAKPNPRFALKQAPLTFVAAATARGAAAALEVRVDDILWREVDNLLDSGPADRHYLLRPGADGHAEVKFGDGREGARPSTGSQNIRATYRSGIGRPGNVRARQLEQLATRPLGVRGVTNPLPATGGADPESRDQARRNAPVTTMALDRLVSLQDHADFARVFAGIAKARATRLSDGARRFVHLTIAAEADAPLDSTTDVVVALKRALAGLGDPAQPVIVAPRELRLLIVAARIAIDKDRRWETVVAAARTRLYERFGFENRPLAAGLSASEIIAALQSVPGVRYVDLDTFGSVATVDGPGGNRQPLTPARFTEATTQVFNESRKNRLDALPARRDRNGALLPAELLLLSPEVPATLILNEIR